MAGGIGLAPLRPVAYEISAKRKTTGRLPFSMGRAPLLTYSTEELEGWGKRNGVQAHVTVDRASGTWSGNVGVVTTLDPPRHSSTPAIQWR